MKDSLRHFSELDRAYHLHSFTDLKQHESEEAIVIEYGNGIYLVDSKGRKYLDAMSSLWCATLGYSEPRLVEAAKRQMESLPYSHTFRGRSSEKLALLAEKLIALSPPQLTKAYFAGSGSEANESAIKIAWTYHKFTGNPRKRKIISRFNGYHGSAIFSTHLSGMPAMHEFSSARFPEIIYADFPNYFTEARHGESESEFAARLANQLERLIAENDPETIAAFIAEPIMGVGGVIVPPNAYFEKIQPILRKHGILFIVDEIICGFGRTGEMFGSITFNLKPDILTVAKGMSSAYFPISATLVTDPIYLALVESSAQKGVFSHGFTYSGHPVGAAVALETLAILEEREIVRHVKTVSKPFQQAVRQLDEYDHVTNRRGVGLMAGFDLVQNKRTRANFPPELGAGAILMNSAEKNGLFVRAIGDAVVIAPPLIIAEEEIDELFDRLRWAIEQTQILLS